VIRRDQTFRIVDTLSSRVAVLRVWLVSSREEWSIQAHDTSRDLGRSGGVSKRKHGSGWMKVQDSPLRGDKLVHTQLLPKESMMDVPIRKRLVHWRRESLVEPGQRNQLSADYFTPGMGRERTRSCSTTAE
jgi:hypothetical protein